MILSEPPARCRMFWTGGSMPHKLQNRGQYGHFTTHVWCSLPRTVSGSNRIFSVWPYACQFMSLNKFNYMCKRVESILKFLNPPPPPPLMLRARDGDRSRRGNSIWCSEPHRSINFLLSYSTSSEVWPLENIPKISQELLETLALENGK